MIFILWRGWFGCLQAPEHCLHSFGEPESPNKYSIACVPSPCIWNLPASYMSSNHDFAAWLGQKRPLSLKYMCLNGYEVFHFAVYSKKHCVTPSRRFRSLIKVRGLPWFTCLYVTQVRVIMITCARAPCVYSREATRREMPSWFAFAAKITVSCPSAAYTHSEHFLLTFSMHLENSPNPMFSVNNIVSLHFIF